jgi:putative chitinase
MNKATFYAVIRPHFGGKLDAKQVQGLDALLDECAAQGADLSQAAYIIATAHGETGGRFQPTRENMSYTAERIRQVWPSRFPSIAAAKPFERNPIALANKVYNGRMGNFEGSNDGWVFRGNGIPQLTGRDNHAKWGRNMGLNLLLKPELLNDLSVSVRALVQPMLEGWATGLRLDEFVAGKKRNYTGARRVWGGVDPDKYAALAKQYEVALFNAGYAPAKTLDTKPLPVQNTAHTPAWLTGLLNALRRMFGVK